MSVQLTDDLRMIEGGGLLESLCGAGMVFLGGVCLGGATVAAVFGAVPVAAVGYIAGPSLVGGGIAMIVD